MTETICLGENKLEISPSVKYLLKETSADVIAVNCVSNENEAILALGDFSFARELKNQGAVIEANKNEVKLGMKPNSAVVFEIEK